MNLSLRGNSRKEMEMEKKVEVTKIFTFDSAHSLVGYDGDCCRLHGHTYKLEVTVTKDPLVNGMVMDFKVLNQIVKDTIISKLDHRNLNEVLFPMRTTAENISIWMLDILSARLFGYSREKGWGNFSEITISKIRLWETPNSFADAYYVNEEEGLCKNFQ